MNGRILVLGATGTVGGHLVGRLATRGVSVRAATRRPEQVRARTSTVEWVGLDLERPETFAPALNATTAPPGRRKLRDDRVPPSSLGFPSRYGTVTELRLLRASIRSRGAHGRDHPR